MSNLTDSEIEKVELLSRTPEILPHEIIKGDILGSGSFGSVWKGTCRGKECAIKELSAELDEKTIKEFTKECEILMVLRHSNIVTFMGACVQRDNLMIVTELLSGDLENLIRDMAPLSLIQTLKMMRDIAQGMAWLHNSNPQIIHRDLKPKNILLDEHSNVKICDFGLSLMKPKEQIINTRAGSFIWMAPEALLREPHNEKVDIYSFGVVCWQLLSMNPQPYKEYLELGSLEAFIEAVCTRGERPSLKGQPKIVKALIKRLWDNDPTNRPDFQVIISELNDLMLECALIDLDAREFWKSSFEGRIDVPFNDFFHHLCGHLNLEIDDPHKVKCMEVLCGSYGVRDVNKKEPVVTLERFGLLLKWFGPLTLKNKNIVDKIYNLVKEKWFHGEVPRETLSRITTEQIDDLKSKKQKGNLFLVRFSESEPIQDHPFSITVISKSGAVSHRINYDTDTGIYSVQIQKGEEVITTSNADVISLMNAFFLSKTGALKLKRDKFLKSELHWSIFAELTSDPIYSKVVEDDD